MAKATRVVKRVPRSRCIGGTAAVCIGIALAVLGVFMALSFMSADIGIDVKESAKSCWTGLLGAYISYGAMYTVGKIPAMVLAILLFCWGAYVARTMQFITTWPAVFGGFLIIAAAALGTCAFADTYEINSGGLLTVYVAPPALLYFGRWGLVLAAAAVMVLGILLSFGEAAVGFVYQIAFMLRDVGVGLGGALARLRDLFKMLVSPRLAVAGGGVARQNPAGKAKERDGAARDLRSGAERRSAADLRAERPHTAAVPPQTPAPEPAAAPEPVAVAEPGVESYGEPERPPVPPVAKRAVTDESTMFTPPPKKTSEREWRPREPFRSRYIDLDVRADSVETASEPVQAKIAQDNGPPAPADIIMDIEAMASESDLLAADESVSEVEARPVPKARPQPPPAQSRPAAATPPPSPPPAPRQRPAQQPIRAGAYGHEVPVQEAQPPAPAPVAEPIPPKEVPDEMAGYQLPPLELLDPPEPPVIEDDDQMEYRARMLEQTLSEFKIEGRVVHVERGPRVTMYEISLAPGIRLNKVTSLADNIAMQLQAESVRIIAPIPGKNTIGIEIPNMTKELVSLREIVSAVNREKRRQALPVCLGKDVAGQALVADLARMPHLLIAGATGSGKSVCINSIILSVMTCCRPDEAQMILVDPKVVELSRFKDIPHLMSPVITDMKRAVSVLEWICQKMDERYEQMSQVSVNNIAKFNAMGEAGIRERLDEFASLEEIEAFPKKLPYMVVIIDELADLMMVAGKEVEQHITRLAAKSRAVGIHLILATQRPSVDVITGLIKANMPCRIAFQVASRVDSRTILDQNGAETLLGQGDMLYLPPGVGKLTRAQGVFVSDEELFRVVDFVKGEAGPQYHADLLGPVVGGGGGEVDVSSFDELFMQSGEAIIENQRGSVSLLQRKFGIGYGRASRIIDQLASVGLLGPFRDGKAREILLTMEEFHSKFGKSASFDDGGGMAGLRDDEREREQIPWDDEEDR